jgi:hypothetical protein
LIDATEPTVVGANRPLDELSLSELQREQGYSTVQRTGGGAVKVFLPDVILVHERNAWTAKPYSRDMVWPLLPHVADPSYLDHLLDMAVHVLSPAGIGATLVARTSRASHCFVRHGCYADEVSDVSRYGTSRRAHR